MISTRPLFLSLAFTALTLTACSDPERTVDELPDPEVDLKWAAYQDWSPALWCKLLTNEDPMVRVMASYQAEPALRNEKPLICPEPMGEIDPTQIRLQAMQQAPDNPAVLAHVYRADCSGQTASTVCDRAAVLERLVSADPDNAHTHLLLFEDSSNGQETPGALTSQDLSHLNDAAATSHYDEYFFAGIHDTYLAINDALPELPPLKLDEETQQLADAEYAGDMRLTEPVVMLFAVLVAQAAPVYGPFSDHCLAAASQGEKDVTDACLQIADLMRDTGRTDLAITIGRGIRHSVGHPEFTGAARETEHPDRWQQSREGLVQQCLRARGLPGDGQLSGPMPAEHLGLFLNDFQHATEKDANRNAAMREYALYPDDFIIDPARCEEMYTLNENTQQSLAALWRTNIGTGLDQPNPALFSLAEALQ